MKFVPKFLAYSACLLFLASHEAGADACSAFQKEIASRVSAYRLSKKKETFPAADRRAQLRYLRSLKNYRGVEPLFFRDQCLSSCGSNAFATVHDHFAKLLGLDAALSSNLLLATNIRLGAQQALNNSVPANFNGEKVNDLALAFSRSGFVTRKSFRDDPLVDTPSVRRRVEKVVEVTQRALATREGEEKREKILSEADQHIVRVLEASFGKLPRNESGTDRLDDFLEQFGRIDAQTVTTALWGQGEVVRSMEAVGRSLSEGTPVMVGYRHAVRLYEPELGRYDSPHWDQVKENGEGHGAAVIGLGNDPKTDEPILVLQNSHKRVPYLFVPMGYFEEYGFFLRFSSPANGRGPRGRSRRGRRMLVGY